jgi:hypothetical protein
MQRTVVGGNVANPMYSSLKDSVESLGKKNLVQYDSKKQIITPPDKMVRQVRNEGVNTSGSTDVKLFNRYLKPSMNCVNSRTSTLL